MEQIMLFQVGDDEIKDIEVEIVGRDHELLSVVKR